jgi:hypothetical protein
VNEGKEANAMPTMPNYLECRLHLAGGEARNFVAEGPEAVQNILDQVRRGRVFQEASLVIAQDLQVHVFPGSAIERIDLIPDETLGEDFVIQDVGTENGAVGREITEEVWRERVEEMERTYTSRREALGREGDPIHAYGQISFSGGKRVFIDFSLSTPGVNEQRRYLRHVFEIPSLPLLRRGGGVSILNPGRVVHAAFHPGAEPPANAWRVRPQVG